MLEPNPIVAAAIIKEINVVNQAMKSAETTYDALLVARDKNRNDLSANDMVRLGLAEKRDALHAHLILVTPPMSDEERAAFEAKPGVIEP